MVLREIVCAQTSPGVSKPTRAGLGSQKIFRHVTIFDPGEVKLETT
jgi:hypothetical protein